jgi:hypothetical protein
MKKLFTLITLTFLAVTGVQAQTTFSVNLVTPANNSNHLNGDNMMQSAIVTVTGGSVAPTDTVAFGDPLISQNNQVYIRTGQTKGMNDTMIFNYSYTGVSGQLGARNWCVSSFLFSGGTFASNFDTTGGTWSTCNTLTFTGDPFSLKDVTFRQNTPRKLTIFPNPVIGDLVNMDFIAQSAEEVNVNVFDLTGRKILTQSFGKAFKGQDGYNLDISALNKGMYIMELRQGALRASGQFTK